MPGEQKIQKQIIDYLQKFKCYIIKTVVTTKAGVPDLIVCYKGKFIALEVKTDKGETTPLQYYNLREIEKAGGWGYIVRSVEDVQLILKQLK